MSNLFISHSSQDNEAARELEARLREQGHDSVFLDFDPEKGIEAGVSWEQTLYRRLRACRAVIALVSDSYLASQWCFAEVALARMEGKELFVLAIDPWSEGTTMPSILTEEQFIDLRQGKDRDEGYQRLWNGFKVKGIVPEQLRKWRPDEPPYPGLRAFEEEDEPLFFGRDEEVREGLELLNRVRRQGQPRLVMVLGASGSGKSSLTRAGILPRLRRDAARWRVVGPIRPGRAPARELAAALAGAFDQAGAPRSWEELLGLLDPAAAAAAEPAPADQLPTEQLPAEALPSELGQAGVLEAVTDAEARQRLLEALLAAEEGLGAADRAVVESVRRLKAYLGAPEEEPRRPPAGAPSSGRDPLGDLTTRLRLAGESKGAADATVVLVIDQFEELLGREEQGAADPANRFLALLREALTSQDDPPLVLATMRSDFLGMLQRSLPLQGVDFQSLSVGPMSREGMFDVVTRPADLGGLKLDDGLADRILTDTETSDALPLLAFTLRTMWDLHHDEGRLRLAHYEGLGGIQGAVARVADETLKEALALGSEKTLRRAFLSLARQTAEGTGWTRRPKAWDDLEPEAQPMLEKFIANRLLVKAGDGNVEVAHEALFRSWDTLSGWLEANAEAFRLLREIQLDAAQWDDAATPEAKRDYLFRGGRLARARELREAGVLELDERDLAFIEESHRVEQAQMQAELRRTRYILAGVTAAFLGALALAWFAWQQSILARDKALVAVAADWLDRDPTRSALVLLELRKPQRAPRAVALMSGAATQRLARVELAGHTGPVVSAVFGRRGAEPVVLTASRDGTARIWSASGDGQPVVLEHTDEVLSADYQPGGDRVVTTLLDGTSRLWTPEALAAGAKPRVLEQGGEIHTAAFSDDGARIVTASDNGTVRLWTADGEPVRAADGRDLVLDLDPEDQNLQANSAAFAPQSHRVLAATNGAGLYVWSPEAGGELVSFDVSGDEGLHTLAVRRAAFDPEGRRIVTASLDGTARLWQVDGTPIADGQGNPVVLRHAGPVNEAVFDQTGTRVLTASDDGTVRIWNVDGTPAAEPDGSPVVLGHSNGVASVRLSPDGASILTACKDGTSRIWSTAPPAEPLMLRHPEAGHKINSVAFSPDGESIVTASRDGFARFWAADSGRPMAPPAVGDPPPGQAGGGPERLDLSAGHRRGKTMRTVLSPAGDLFLSASEGGTARLWRADNTPVWGGGDDPVLLRHDGRINRAAFSSDGELIVTASKDGTARIWQTADASLVATLPHEAEVRAAAFSPNGKRIVTAAKDKFARVWSLARVSSIDGTLVGINGTVELELEHTAEVQDARFSPDGRWIVTAWGLRASVYPATGGAPVADFEGHEEKLRSAAFDPSGKRVVTTSYDKSARVWSADGEGDPLVLRAPGSRMEEAAFNSPDGDLLLTSSWVPEARVWRTTFAGLGAAIREAAPRACLPPAFREKSLGEDRRTAGERFELCRRCLTATGLAGYRACILPAFP